MDGVHLPFRMVSSWTLAVEDVAMLTRSADSGASSTRPAPRPLLEPRPQPARLQSTACAPGAHAGAISAQRPQLQQSSSGKDVGDGTCSFVQAAKPCADHTVCLSGGLSPPPCVIPRLVAAAEAAAAITSRGVSDALAGAPSHVCNGAVPPANPCTTAEPAMAVVQVCVSRCASRLSALLARVD